MDSFEELELAPVVVEALAAEGLERPTPLQAAAIPVLRRGNNLHAHGGPGGGTLMAYGSALLDRIDPDGATPAAVVLVPTPEVAGALAESLARVALLTGHGVAALGTPWVLPQRASILFATPRDLLTAVEGGRLSLEEVSSVIIDQASVIQETEGLEGVERIFRFLSDGAQRAVFALPSTAEVDDLVSRTVRRAVQVPPRPALGGPEEGSPRRGEVRYRLVVESKEEAGLDAVSRMLDDGERRHLLVFVRTEDRAADVGDFLALHGYAAGLPGSPDAPVWLAVDALEALRALDADEPPGVLSWDVPAGPDALDRRHGHGRDGLVLARARELPHLEDLARRAGYRLRAEAAARPMRGPGGDLGELLAAVEGAVEREDVAAYTFVLEDLFERHGPASVAAATLALLRRRSGGGAADETRLGEGVGRTGKPGRTAPAYVRLFISLGERDGLGPGDVLGAVAGEAGIDGNRVGKIDLRESFSLVEVEEPVAHKVIEALNGTTIRGRSVRVDYDRPGPRTRDRGRERRGRQGD